MRRTVPSPEHIALMARLDTAIWDAVCPYCGAEPGNACKQKPRNMAPPTTTNIPHLARVKAGHAALGVMK